ncbi:642_t:CDS:2 [Diversispora eburnea]|uniref:642_t:CDS:1 n=1 Tax=Diversispora eburnea TaxID=1213867 RepID=A0A9N8ZIA1_9GLOM|nr:642_t:CDS:2 [Diversispora eburnea]
MNKTPLTFDMSSNMTIEETSFRTVSIYTTRHEKSNFTVILFCIADSTKLLPLIIFKLVNVPQQIFPSEVIIRTNRKRYMNSDEMICSLTSKLQPLDVSIKKLFKNKYYNNWMAEEIKKLTPTKYIQYPTYNLVVQ